jgi:hypothetical protein
MKKIALLFFLSTVYAAPVPKSGPIQISANEYQVKWNSGEYSYKLNTDGSLEAVPGFWCGFWEWDKSNREFRITETNNNWVSWTHYVFSLDENGSGKCIYSAGSGEPDETPRSVNITLKRKW